MWNQESYVESPKYISNTYIRELCDFNQLRYVNWLFSHGLNFLSEDINSNRYLYVLEFKLSIDYLHK